MPLNIQYLSMSFLLGLSDGYAINLPIMTFNSRRSAPLGFVSIFFFFLSRRRRLWPAMGNLLERDHRDSPDPLRPHEGPITKRFLCPHGELVVHSRACGVARHNGASSAWRMHRTCNPGRNIYGSEPFTARLSPPMARICNRI